MASPRSLQLLLPPLLLLAQALGHDAAAAVRRDALMVTIDDIRPEISPAGISVLANSTSDQEPAPCDVVGDYGAKCDGATDDTARLQAAIDACAPASRPVVLRHSAACISQPLQLRSKTTLVIAAGATLKAGKKWLDMPFLSAVGATDVSIIGNGTVDGSGAQWWTPGSKKTAGRPHLVRFDNVSGARFENITLLNAANHFTYLGGRSYRIFGVKIRSPPFHIAPNSDGLNLRADDVHVKGCDITNGDDSVVMKAPSTNVLVEDTVVRQGNGLVVGTSDDAFFRNITFRRCVAEGTMFACHVKFKDAQSGFVEAVRFEDITARADAGDRAILRGRFRSLLRFFIVTLPR
jgi:polygalacturonase